MADADEVSCWSAAELPNMAKPHTHTHSAVTTINKVMMLSQKVLDKL